MGVEPFYFFEIISHFMHIYVNQLSTFFKPPPIIYLI